MFVETAVFTKRIAKLGLEEGLRQLQKDLLQNPTAGDIDPGTGGLRTQEQKKVLRSVVQAIKGDR